MIIPALYSIVPLCDIHFFSSFLFFLMIRRPPRSTLFPNDALPISLGHLLGSSSRVAHSGRHPGHLGISSRHHLPPARGAPDRKSTRLNSSHANISYAVFCLKKKK